LKVWVYSERVIRIIYSCVRFPAFRRKTSEKGKPLWFGRESHKRWDKSFADLESFFQNYDLKSASYAWFQINISSGFGPHMKSRAPHGGQPASLLMVCEEKAK
jgi:hypothetical protein